eukprot:CAMPEP_0195271694 /NCGR_PEP_ID=MMETSP0706-20130129/15248_1 /TAXON_ID=33640 /ORGANISM="Asterionellopsis glacialis, Strain CCMP134" /LENGTH=75 /DNA_ID=CAMNT_0040327505 /DNA_START=30 /DNA_END=253 /DNA_ORIENTATION=-
MTKLREEQLSGELLGYYADGNELEKFLSAVDDNASDTNIDDKRIREDEQEDDRRRKLEERDPSKIFSNDIMERVP